MTDLIEAIKSTVISYPKTKERQLIVSKAVYNAAKIAVSINENGFKQVGDDIYFLDAKIIMYNYL